MLLYTSYSLVLILISYISGKYAWLLKTDIFTHFRYQEKDYLSSKHVCSSVKCCLLGQRLELNLSTEFVYLYHGWITGNKCISEWNYTSTYLLCGDYWLRKTTSPMIPCGERHPLEVHALHGPLRLPVCIRYQNRVLPPNRNTLLQITTGQQRRWVFRMSKH